MFKLLWRKSDNRWGQIQRLNEGTYVYGPVMYLHIEIGILWSNGIQMACSQALQS